MKEGTKSKVISVINKLLLLVLFFGFPVSAQILSDSEINKPFLFGIPAETPVNLGSVLNRTIEKIKESSPEFSIVLVKEPLKNIMELLEQNQLDFAFLPSVSFAGLEAFRGIRAVAALKHPKAKDSSMSSTMTALVLKNSTVERLGDLKNLKVGIAKGEAEFQLPLLIGELSVQNGSQIHFKNVKFGREAELLEGLKKGELGAVLLPPCRFEILSGKGQYKVLEPRFLDKFDCQHSSSMLPGWFVVSSFQSNERDNRKLGGLLKISEIPTDLGNFIWESPKSIREVHRLLQTAQDPEYFSYTHETFGEFLKRNILLGVSLLIVIATLLLHSWLSERLVRKRTRQLKITSAEKEEIKDDFVRMEKLAIVGQMSSMFAHEVKQPLTAIYNFASGLQRRAAKNQLDEETLSKSLTLILNQADRIQSVVDHVRSYAREQKKPRILFNLSKSIQTTVDKFSKSKPSDLEIDTHLSPDVFIFGDTFEFETVLLNLLKNASDATESQVHRIINVELKQNSKQISLVVENTGGSLSSEELSQLGKAFITTKSSGLGLGLGIVIRIVESYGGKVVFSNSKLGGLSVKMSFPKVKE